MEKKRKLELDIKYVIELLNYQGRSLSGKVMKRFEIIDDKKVLKNEVKELIYEELRNLRDLLVAGGTGLGTTTIWNFKRREKE